MKLNRERIEDCKETLDQLSNLLGEVLDGKKTQAQIAKELGITSQELNHNLNSKFSNYLKKNHVFSDNEVVELFKGTETPCERIVYDILEIKSKDKFLILDEECQELFKEEIKTVLKSKEYDVVSRYYGLDANDASTLAEIAKEFDVSTSYINQLRGKALRRLRSDACFIKLFPQFKDYFIKLEDTNIGEKISSVIPNLKRDEIEKLEAIQRGKAFVEGGIDVSVLDLPISLYLTLRRNQIDTVAELISKTKNDILAIHGIGSKGLEDIKKALLKFGLRLKPVI